MTAPAGRRRSLERQQVDFSCRISASYLFEKAGVLGHVTDLAGGWFARHLAQASTIAPAA